MTVFRQALCIGRSVEVAALGWLRISFSTASTLADAHRLTRGGWLSFSYPRVHDGFSILTKHNRRRAMNQMTQTEAVRYYAKTPDSELERFADERPEEFMSMMQQTEKYQCGPPVADAKAWHRMSPEERDQLSRSDTARYNRLVKAARHWLLLGGGD